MAQEVQLDHSGAAVAGVVARDFQPGKASIMNLPFLKKVQREGGIPCQQVFHDPWHRLQLAAGHLLSVHRTRGSQQEPLGNASQAKGVFTARGLDRILHDPRTDWTQQLLVDIPARKAVHVEAHLG